MRPKGTPECHEIFNSPAAWRWCLTDPYSALPGPVADHVWWCIAPPTRTRRAGRW